VTGLIVSTAFTAQTTLPGIPAMLFACLTSIAANFVMSMIPFAKNAVKTAQIHTGWYMGINRIDPAQRNLDPPCTYISVVNISSQ